MEPILNSIAVPSGEGKLLQVLPGEFRLAIALFISTELNM